MKHALLLALLLSLSLSLPVFSFQGESDQVHSEIVHDALAADLTGPNLAMVQSGCNAANKAGSESEDDMRLHFGEDNMSKCLAAMDRQKKLVLDFAVDADTNVENRARTLYHFGKLLHTAQDFYFHTNYLEFTINQLKEKNAKFPDLYSLPLVDWTHMPAGRNLLTGAEFYKDTPTSAGGKVALPGTTYFKVAKDLAVRETTRQWTLLQALLKLKAPTRADLIVTALKQASCPKNVDVDALP